MLLTRNYLLKLLVVIVVEELSVQAWPSKN